MVGALALSAQSDNKIKGSRNVTIKQTYIDDFESIIVKSDFDIEIAFNSKPSVEVEADDNLHDVIQFNVSNGVLTLNASKRITSKKKLLIRVNYGTLLNTIEVYDSAEIRSLTSMELGDASLSTYDNSRAYLNIKAKTLNYKASGKSKTRLNITADSTMIEMSDDCKLDALITSKSSKFDLYQRANATIEGDVDNSILRLDNSSDFNGKNYSIKNCTLIIEGNSDAVVLITENAIIDASGNTETFLYGKPKITLNTFIGTAKLQKKEL